jgi:hypothetical protein
MNLFLSNDNVTIVNIMLDMKRFRMMYIDESIKITL